VSKLRASQEVEEFHPEYELKPSVYYIGLPKRFIAGEVILGDQEDECAAGVDVKISGESKEETVKTDCFGDFEFEGLEPNAEYTIKIEHDGYAFKEMNIRTVIDVNLGEIVLTKE
jgi:hypothetical protein